MAAIMGSISAYGCYYQTNGAKALKQSRHMQFQQCSSSGVRFLNKKTQSVQRKTQLAKRRAARDGLYPKATRSRAPIVCPSGMTIILVSTEVQPWSKTGGLGDVLGGLPPVLAVSIVCDTLLVSTSATTCSLSIYWLVRFS
jgi:granule-bound starch synthase